MKDIHIIVCTKLIRDPEAPSSVIKVDSEAKRVTFLGVPPVINPFDENALEAAVLIKEQCGGHITIVSMGTKISSRVLSKALAVGGDQLILLDDEHFKDLDSRSAAYVLSEAIKKVGKYDLILTGRQAADGNSGQTGLILGEILQIPTINLARSVKVEDNKAIVEKVKRDGYEILEAPLPALITASNEVGDLRFAPLKEMAAARRKPVETWTADDIGVDLQKLKYLKVVKLYKPTMERSCRFVEGAAPEEMGENLARLLKENGVIK